ncbi:MAG: type II toxin-antitoxin system VapC family toxin [Blastocatellia bacterium]
MKSATVLFDTQVYITYGSTISSRRIEPGRHSVVVWQERMVGASGSKHLKRMESECKRIEEEGRLLIPDREAWMMAGRILYRYLSDLSRQSPARLRPALGHAEKQNIIRDVLIAVSAKKGGVTVVSDNKDFPTIQRYYDFKWISGREYFSA